MRTLAAVARLAVGATMAGLMSALLVAPAAAADAPSDTFERLLNDSRTAVGLPPMERDGRLDAVAYDWSTVMAAERQLYHRPDLASTVDARVTTTWIQIGENVGVGESIERLHEAFLASPAHHANVVGDYNRVGIGVVSQGDDFWVTFNFMRVPAATSAQGSFILTGGDGSVLAAGDVPLAGSLQGIQLSQPIVGAALTTSGDGYWMVARDGGVFSFGDAAFFGSTGHLALNQPIVGMAPTPTGRGYWMVARDGGVFSFGEAAFHGSTAGAGSDQPVVAIAPTPSGRGYRVAAANGAVYGFGDAGGSGLLPTTSPVVAFSAA